MPPGGYVGAILLLLSGCHLVQRVSYRQIGEADIPSIATLLVRGFPKHRELAASA